MAVGAGVGGVEQLHGPQVDLAALEREREGRLESELFSASGRQPLVDEGVDRRVLLAEDPGVVGVGGDALEAEKQGVLEGEDVGACPRGSPSVPPFPPGQ